MNMKDAWLAMTAFGLAIMPVLVLLLGLAWRANVRLDQNKLDRPKRKRHKRDRFAPKQDTEQDKALFNTLGQLEAEDMEES